MPATKYLYGVYAVPSFVFGKLRNSYSRHRSIRLLRVSACDLKGIPFQTAKFLTFVIIKSTKDHGRIYIKVRLLLFRHLLWQCLFRMEAHLKGRIFRIACDAPASEKLINSGKS